MARPELGAKRVCPTTGRKFYDLNRDPIVSPYTGEVIARTSFEPAPTARAAAASRARVVEEDEVEAVPAGPETISLEDVASEENAGAGEDEAVLGEEEAAAGEENFLEEEEEAGDDVVGLIDGDIEEDEET